MLGCSTRELDVTSPLLLGHDGLLVQDRKDARAGGDRALKGHSERGERGRRTEGAEDTDRCQYDGPSPHGTRLKQQGAQDELSQAEQQDEPAGDCVAVRGPVVEQALNAHELARTAVELLQPTPAGTKLACLAQASQAVQHEPREVARKLAAPASRVARQPGEQHGHQRPHHKICDKSDQSEERVEAPHEHDHDDRGAYRYADGRDRVRVEHLEQLHVSGDGGDEAALVGPGELGGGQAPQRGEHPITYRGEQLEGDVVVAGLLDVMEHSAHDGHCHKNGDDARKREPGRMRDHTRRGEARRDGEDGDERRTQMAHDAEEHGERDGARHGARKAEHAPHDMQVAARFDVTACLATTHRTHGRPPLDRTRAPAACARASHRRGSPQAARRGRPPRQSNRRRGRICARRQPRWQADAI